MSVVITSDSIVIPDGVVSSGLTVDLNGEIDVLSGGTLTDSLATNGGWILVDNGGTVQKVSATAEGDVFVNGKASELAAEGKGMFDIDSGGTLDTGLIKSGGMGAIYADATADKVTILDGGKFLNYGGTVRNTVISGGGSFTVQFATADTSSTNVLEGATMRIVSAGNATDTTVNGGFLEIDSGIAAKTVVSAGSMRVNKSNTVEGVTLLGGKLELNEATANTTVVNGGTVFVFSSGSIAGTTMTDGSLELFSGTATKTVISGGAMRVDMFNSITDTTLNNGNLTISAASANTTVVNGGAMQVVSGGTFFGTTVNAGQLTMDKGATFTDTTIKGGTASFTGAAITNIEIGSGAAVTMDSESTLGGFADFIAGAIISIDGTIAFDTALTTAETAQINGLSVAATGENAAYTLTDEAAVKGTYLLATGADGFNGDVAFGEYILRVNMPVIVDDLLSYTLSITESNDLALVIADKPDIPALVYANSEWTGLAKDTIVEVKVGTAKIGYDAFALLADAIAGVTVDGTVEIVGGTISFADGYSKTIVVDAEASVVGTATFDKPITINGTVVFDTSIATAEAAQFGGFSNIDGTAIYTLNVPELNKGTYLLASDAATFNSTVTYGKYTLEVGKSVVVDSALTFTLGITGGNELALTIADYIPGTPTQTYANSNWATKQEGDIVTVTGGTAKIGYDAFATLSAAIAGASDDGKINVTGGTVSFADGYSKTVTVEDEATVVGKATFDKEITIEGTFAFDTAIATAEAAQIGGFSFVSGAATYTLTDEAANKGTYLLASGVVAFDNTVAFGEYTLKVGEDVLVNDSLVYTLGLTDGTLALTIADKPGPTPPTPTTFVTKSDIDGNGISDVLFVWTGEHGEGNYQQGYWMNGTNTWQSANAAHPSDWIPLGAHDMNNNGKADSVMFGNVYTETSGKGAYIGYYIDADDASTVEHPTWQNIGYLNNEEDITWQNCVGNLNGEKNSIVWYAPDLYAVGIWVGMDEYPEWIHLSASFGGPDWNLIGCGDFDGDGKDAVVMNYNNGQFIYTVDITGDTKSLGTLQWTGWQLRAIGDFSGDGKDDIVLFHEETGSMVLCTDGNLDDYKSIGQLAADDWFVVGAGDYNGDKKDDLLVRQYSTGMLGYYVCADQNQWVELGRGVGMEWTVIA